MNKVVHRFIRSANIDSNVYNRVANRFDPFKNTQITLEDPANNRTLTLIGTTNSSTTLAHRTRLLLDKIKPDAVYVQTSPTWWKYAQHVNVETQPLFTQASRNFPETPYKYENNPRGLMFRARYGIWKYCFESLMQFPEDFGFFRPGLQTYYALKYADANGAKIGFGGSEYDPETIQALRLEPDLYPHTLTWRILKLSTNTCTTWKSIYDDFINTVHVRGGQAFAESIDRSRINYFVGFFNKIAPKQKKIFIDHRDERIFKEIYDTKGKNIVAVVNQWHMQGIQTHWRGITNTSIKETSYNPVADMPIDEIQETNLVNEWLRDYTSHVTRSEPASWQNYLTNYLKENYEAERTRHINPQTHEDVPAPGEKPKSGHH